MKMEPWRIVDVVINNGLMCHVLDTPLKLGDSMKY